MNTGIRLTPAMLAAEALGFGILAGTPAAIYASEKRGQAELVQSTNMPIDLHDRTAFERCGFVFGDKIDDVFQVATLPPGWFRQATDHSMWSKICDDKSRDRVSVFYKAAFYDRRAHASLILRFRIGSKYEEDGHVPYIEVTDCGKPVKTFGHWTTKPESHESRMVRYREVEEQEKIAENWMRENYPNWKDPTAYWD